MAEQVNGPRGNGTPNARRRPAKPRRPRRRPPRPTVADRFDAVDRLLDGDVTDAGGVWSRATAWILRLALEQAVDQLWLRTTPELARCPMRAQLLALRVYAGPETAAQVATVWAALSRAAHHHDYELAPSVTELRRWREQTAAVAAVLARVE
ncbi:hypothetical protein [Nocardia goodfellowii]|uniref:DUF4129 domain-containing protein n=1 Tax=Nocardia goodfellowii TaxID=882446 RepID=A0ABS4QCU6_9NOCA|nr:hypothetical protein [Nocardia goodfellowii]MBP2189388.1 hypothetical protein [Nocardia goodfellowii]